MRRNLTTSLIVIVVVAFGALAATLAVGNSPELGLDLQGGASVVLRPEGNPESDAIDQAIEIIRSRVDALGVAEPDITRQGDDIVVQLPGVTDSDRALEVVGQTAELRFRPVISSLPPEGTALPESTTTTVPGATTTTVPGATTTTAPGATPTTAAPGETTTTAAPAGTEDGALGTGATDDGADVADAAAAGTAEPLAQGATTTAPPATTSPATTSPATTSPATTAAPDTTATTAPGTTATTLAPGTPAQTSAQPTGDVPTTKPDDDVADQQVVLPELDEDGKVVQRYVLAPASATGEIVDDARATFQGNEWVVEVDFTGDGSKRFDEIAAENVQRQLAITLDGRVISAPVIQQSNFGGTAVISGDFDQGDAQDLALVLRYGALPVELNPQAVQQVSATLGQDSLHAGIIAGIIGTLVVLLYITLYYRALGLVVLAGLCVWGAFQWAIISYLGATQGLALSLAGATGIIVSVGVTVDSYIVYFERLKDEVRAGRSMRSAVDRGFSRAFRTILAADASAFIGAALLYWLTVGPVRGFAFFLGLSTILDVLVAYFFTRPLVGILGRKRFFTHSRFGVAHGMVTPTPAGAPGA